MTTPPPDRPPEIVTFGCRLNTYESEVMRGLAQDAALTDTVIINTCAVTAEAERQARQMIRKLRRERPEARIIVTGCAAQINPERFAAMPEVDQVLGNSEKLKSESFGLDRGAERVRVNDIMAIRETAGHLIDGPVVRGFEGRARAFVQVQNGCDHRCTFCIIPFGRGPSRSAAIGEIVAQVRALTGAGYREVVLTGVDITAYGADLPGQPPLGQMVRRLLAQVPELPRLRLSSLDPVEIDDDLWRLIAEEPRLMPHLHLSLQAGDDMILKRMRRRHSRDDAIATCRRARTLRPGIALGADLIAGFPTETDAMFDNSLELVEACDLTWLHVFPYSARPGTPAAKMPAVAAALRKERAARLRDAGAAAAARFLRSCVGAQTHVLVERETLGRTEHFAEITLDQPVEAGTIVPVSVTAADPERLQGRIRGDLTERMPP
ncbi:MAG: tRNA (N(6)-L-threonylcarbamoyladenosine(37)-C(2))-methylthiotransferase MtaB [Azospirillaceae bacterium]|nr:tRNA (N(6)-L-threonylcarbamoyladenosine(37)-C(2))-methylthiotransferase MtaB [Azospirillaceae bacterium]